jgi:Family of unknown function (DUF6328)
MESTATQASPGSDRWNAEQRAEAPQERADRNFSELVQELRVLMVGVQILFGFLLTLAFGPGFAALDAFRHAVYLVTLLSAAAASTLLVGPVAMHRMLFQSGLKPAVVRGAHRMAVLALVALGITLSAGLLIVLDIAIGRVAAATITAAFVVATAMVWWVIPLWMYRRTD